MHELEFLNRLEDIAFDMFMLACEDCLDVLSYKNKEACDLFSKEIKAYTADESFDKIIDRCLELELGDLGVPKIVYSFESENHGVAEIVLFFPLHDYHVRSKGHVNLKSNNNYECAYVWTDWELVKPVKVTKIEYLAASEIKPADKRSKFYDFEEDMM